MNIHSQQTRYQSTYRGLGLLCVEVLQRVQGTVGLYFRDRTRRGHLGRKRQSVGHQRGWDRGHLDTGITATWSTDVKSNIIKETRTVGVEEVLYGERRSSVP